MFRAGAGALIALGAIHLMTLGIDASSYIRGWLMGDLWTLEHWLPVARQSPALAQSGFAFWSTAGSFAVPMMVLGAVLLWLDRRGLPAPRLAPVVMFTWALTLAALMPPSGFVAGAAARLAVVAGKPRGGWA